MAADQYDPVGIIHCCSPVVCSRRRARKGIAVDFLDESFQGLLISYLYQHLVRYTELNIRHATRLDQAAPGTDEDGESHPLMRTLSGDDNHHPLSILIEQEEASARQHIETGTDHSLAGAHARLLASCQKSAPLPAMDETFIPRPWRRFGLQRVPLQLAFNFDDELPLGWSASSAVV